MIYLLFALILTEMGLITMFVFKTPLRKLVIMGLDRAKMGQGPIVVKTVGATVFVVMLSSVSNVVSIQKRRIQDGDYVNPTDQVLSAKSLLEASLMGFSLFLALMIDRLHYYIRELRIRRKGMEAIKKQNRPIEDLKSGGSEERKALEDEAVMLREKYKKLQSELEAKTKEAKNAESNAIAMRKQSEGFLLEYDRLLEDNQNLRNRLQSVDRGLSHSGSKKVIIGSEPRKSMSILSAVESNKQMNMNTESTVSMNTNPEAAMPFTSRAYADAAIAKKVKGNEYAHHATLNFFIAFLNNAGLVAYTSQNFTN